MISVLLDLAEAIETFISGLAGRRYILSSSYRRETNQRWKQERLFYVAMDIFAGVLGVFFTMFLAGLFVYLIL